MLATPIDTVVTILGWIGGIGGICAYAMVTKGRWSPKGMHFQLTNLVSAGFMCLVAGYHGVWPSMAANVAWVVIGVQAIVIVGLGRYRRTRVRQAPGMPVSPDIELSSAS